MATSTYRIFDGHNDTLLNLHLAERGGGRSFFTESDKGHIDLPRAKRGGLAGGFFAIFVPPVEPYSSSARPGDPNAPSVAAPVPALDPAYAKDFTNQLITLLGDIEDQANGEVRVVRNIRELGRCLSRNQLAAILHFEGAEAIHPDLTALEHFYDRGLRSLGLVWSRPNVYAHGVPFAFPATPDSGPGLTDAGFDLVQECNRLGILIDLSHLNERGFWDVAAITTAPVVVTHGAVHRLCPCSRNLLDDQLDAIGESGGVVGLNFHVGFLRSDGLRDPDMPLRVMVDHIDYLVNRIGVDHVALGSDFDGATMSKYLGDVAGLPKLVDELQRAGYDDSALRKLTLENWLRVLGDTWR